jgi:hypothetical protein
MRPVRRVAVRGPGPCCTGRCHLPGEACPFVAALHAPRAARPEPLTRRLRRQLRALARAARCWLDVFNQYRTHHSWLYAARIAYGIAFRGLPF